MIGEKILFIGWEEPKGLALKVTGFGINNGKVSFILPFVDPLQDYDTRMKRIASILPEFEYFLRRTNKKPPYYA
ncbi:MAG: hypothetical protein AABX29_04885 [Nanoarchaeota archaeon]